MAVKFSYQQLDTIADSRRRNPGMKQRSLARRLLSVYPLTFSGRTFASVYNALRRHDAKIRQVVTQGLAAANS